MNEIEQNDNTQNEWLELFQPNKLSEKQPIHVAEQVQEDDKALIELDWGPEQ